MADVPPAPSSPASLSPAADSDAGDPFLRLHKMSITAGLGSGDYVAISGTAVAAVLLGVASSVVLFHIRFLILIPLAGIICAAVAWVQIGRSNGTLTGRGLAILGLLLSLLLGGYEGGQAAVAGWTGASDRSQVIALIHDFGQDVARGRYEQAYARCDPDFRATVPLPQFEGRWRSAHNSTLLGALSGINWNGLLTFDTDPITGQRTASGMILIQFDRSAEPVRTDMFFRRDEHAWAVDRIPQMFAAPTQGAPTQGAPTQGAPTPGGAAPSGHPSVYGPPKPS